MFLLVRLFMKFILICELIRVNIGTIPELNRILLILLLTSYLRMVTQFHDILSVRNCPLMKMVFFLVIQ